MKRLRPMLPSALAHLARGTSPNGSARAANGLMLQGVITKVYGVADPELATNRNPTQLFAPAVMCDVFIYDPRHTTTLRQVPIMRESAGLVDNDVWIPRASTIDIKTGLLISDGGGALGPPVPVVSDPRNMDGDHVIVGFMSNDLARPIILGQVDHPSNVRNLPTDKTLYKKKRTLRGWTIGMTIDGNIDLNGIVATAGIVTPGIPSVEVPAVPVAGNVNIATAAGAKVSIGLLLAPSPTQEPVILGRTMLTALQTQLTQEQAMWLTEQSTWTTIAAAHTANGLAFTALAQGAASTAAGAAATAATAAAAAAGATAAAIGVTLSAIATSLSAGRPYLATQLETD